MCGIFGVLSAYDINLNYATNNLKKLEYRGYDSAGICAILDDKFVLKKTIKSIENLTSKTKNETSRNIICHTRWATHGKISTKNTHPHVANNISIVHNGIIENYKELIVKFNLKNKLLSDCDSEIIAHIFNLYITTSENLPKQIKQCLKEFKGSYAFLVQCLKFKELVFGAKKESSLFIAKTNFGFCFSSDIAGFDNQTICYCSLDDDEFFIADVKEKKLVVYDKNLNIVNKKFTTYQQTKNCLTNGNFKSYLEKEIFDIPRAFKECKKFYSENLNNSKMLKNFNEINFVACGSAYHSALICCFVIKNTLHKKCNAYIASEFIFENLEFQKKTLFVFISQSGETFDTIQALKKVKKLHFQTLALTNSTNSTLARLCDNFLPLCAGKEFSVASTKAYNCTIFAIHFLCNIKLQHFNERALYKLIQRKDEFLLSSKIVKFKKIIYIGKCEDYFTAMESSLKFRELTYLNSFAFPCGELKHGSLALVDKNTVVIAILTNTKYKKAILNSLSEVKTRQATTILVSTEKIADDVVDYFISIPRIKNLPLLTYSVTIFQKIALYSCEALHLNIDKPRNLAKSVTVQ